MATVKHNVTLTAEQEQAKAAKATWEQIKSPGAWNALSAAQKWEIVRQILAHDLAQKFGVLR